VARVVESVVDPDRGGKSDVGERDACQFENLFDDGALEFNAKPRSFVGESTSAKAIECDRWIAIQEGVLVERTDRGCPWSSSAAGRKLVGGDTGIHHQRFAALARLPQLH
jgi:hypothetical protein